MCSEASRHIPTARPQSRPRGTRAPFVGVMAFLVFALPLVVSSAAAPPEATWKAGAELVKLAPQDSLPGTRATEPNDHPVVLKPEDLAVSLAAIRFERGGRSLPLLEAAAATRLARPLSTALSRASPNEDVLFAAEFSAKPAPIGSSRVTVAGRAFYLNERLNLIIGDLHASTVAPEFYRSLVATTQIDRRLRPHQPGERAQERRFEGARVEEKGHVTLHVHNGATRGDWLVLDVAALLHEQDSKETAGRLPVNERR